MPDMCSTTSASSQNSLWDQEAPLPLYLYGRNKIAYERRHLCCGEVIQSISVSPDQYSHGKDWLFSLSLGPKISVPNFKFTFMSVTVSMLHTVAVIH